VPVPDTLIWSNSVVLESVPTLIMFLAGEAPSTRVPPSSISIGTGDSLSFNDGRDLTITGVGAGPSGAVINNGNILMNSVGSITDLKFEGDITLTGTGTITMSDHANNRILGNGGTLTHDTSHTIQGAGQLGVSTMGFINKGTIDATQVTVQLKIDPNSNDFVNQGTLRSTGSAGLSLLSATYINTGPNNQGIYRFKT